MVFRKNTGFTLVELLVVMSIIGVLVAALTTQVGKGREIARGLKCKANLRNLAQAALNYGVDHTRLPWAGSHEDTETVRSAGRYVMKTRLRKGWVDWTTKNPLDPFEDWPRDYEGGPSVSGKGTLVCYAGGTADGALAMASVTNGTLWSYMGRDVATYVCESHRNALKPEEREGLVRSYVMNGYFGYNKDYMPISRKHRDIWLNSLSSGGNASELLLFAELADATLQYGSDANKKVDGVLETEIAGYNDGADTISKPSQEILGFNHLVGKRKVAHVVYADGHVDVVHATGLTESQEKGLVYLLCNGKDLPADTSKWKVP